jgi:hypothetical protein
MSVHRAITAHVNELNQKIRQFAILDRQREEAIEEACRLCREGKAFSTDKINEITEKMNLLSKQIENLPERKYVTMQMVIDYVNSQK